MSQVYPETPLSPGHLLAPPGWAVKPLVSVLEHDPSLYRALFSMSHTGLHLIGLALAHWECDPTQALAGC